FHFKNMTLPGLSELDAKLSIKKKEDGTPTLFVHPIRNTAKNSFDLSQEQMDKLSAEGTNWVGKKLTNEKGQEEDYLVTLDKETNEYVAFQKKTIKAPDEINGQKLNDDQKKNFIEGNNIDIDGEQFQLSPNEIGIDGSDGNTYFKSVKFNDVMYKQDELLFDLAIMMSGAAPWLLIGKSAVTLVKGFINQASNNKSNVPEKGRQNSYSEAELRTAAEIAKPQIEMAIKSDKANLKEKDIDNEWGAKGTLVDYGRDNYKFKKENEKSFYLKLENEQGQSREIWGTDLSRALDESNA